jgi:sugar porter (SP) family MFS transporter
METANIVTTHRRSTGVTRRLLFWSLTSALAGFIFGFDTVVISGAEQKIQALWELSPGMHGVAMGSALYGTVLGSSIGGWPADRFGRRPTLLAVGLLYVISALWSALAGGVYPFIAARVIGGLGIGISTVAAPLYISEISSPKHRGRLAGLFQFNIVFGIVAAYASNAALAGIGEDSWRWMLAAAAIPSILYTVFCLGIPESPRWILSKGNDRAEGVAVLRLIRPDASPAQIDAEANEILAAAAQGVSTGRFWSKSLRGPILLAFLIAFFNQLSGINAVLYFAPRIFEMAGLGAQAALLQSVGIGVTILVFTLLGLCLIDRVGRRTLLYIGSYGYILSLGVIAWGFFSHHLNIISACIFIFIAAHGVGQGTVIWVFISEIFPNRHRAEGQALGSFTHWIFAALITTVFPNAVGLFAPGYIFAFFCGMMVLQLIWVATMVPETKGIPLEQIEDRLIQH